MGHAPSDRRAGSRPPDDAEAKKALADCALNQNRQQMRTALQKSDWQTALSYSNQILALEPGDDEAQKAVRDCTLAVSRQSVHKALQKRGLRIKQVRLLDEPFKHEQGRVKVPEK